MKFTILLLTLLLGFTFSCAPLLIEGRKIDPEKVDQLMVGEEKVEKVEEFFGKPTQIEKIASGGEKFVYRYVRINPHWWTIDKVSKQKLEVVIVDGVVQGYEFREEGKEVVLKRGTLSGFD
jgi:outer membrane protein assembly factor BamE (lipoprotein component of BamABCDE complex)